MRKRRRIGKAKCAVGAVMALSLAAAPAGAGESAATATATTGRLTLESDDGRRHFIPGEAILCKLRRLPPPDGDVNDNAHLIHLRLIDRAGRVLVPGRRLETPAHGTAWWIVPSDHTLRWPDGWYQLQAWDGDGEVATFTFSLRSPEAQAAEVWLRPANPSRARARDGGIDGDGDGDSDGAADWRAALWAAAGFNRVFAPADDALLGAAVHEAMAIWTPLAPDNAPPLFSDALLLPRLARAARLSRTMTRHPSWAGWLLHGGFSLETVARETDDDVGVEGQWLRRIREIDLPLHRPAADLDAGERERLNLRVAAYATDYFQARAVVALREAADAGLAVLPAPPRRGIYWPTAATVLDRLTLALPPPDDGESTGGRPPWATYLAALAASRPGKSLAVLFPPARPATANNANNPNNPNNANGANNKIHTPPPSAPASAAAVKKWADDDATAARPRLPDPAVWREDGPAGGDGIDDDDGAVAGRWLGDRVFAGANATVDVPSPGDYPVLWGQALAGGADATGRWGAGDAEILVHGSALRELHRAQSRVAGVLRNLRPVRYGAVLQPRDEYSLRGELSPATAAWATASLRAGLPLDPVYRDDVAAGRLLDDDGQPRWPLLLLTNLARPLDENAEAGLSAYIEAGGLLYVDTASETYPNAPRLPSPFAPPAAQPSPATAPAAAWTAEELTRDAAIWREATAPLAEAWRRAPPEGFPADERVLSSDPAVAARVYRGGTARYLLACAEPALPPPAIVDEGGEGGDGAATTLVTLALPFPDGVLYDLLAPGPPQPFRRSAADSNPAPGDSAEASFSFDPRRAPVACLAWLPRPLEAPRVEVEEQRENVPEIPVTDENGNLLFRPDGRPQTRPGGPGIPLSFRLSAQMTDADGPARAVVPCLLRLAAPDGVLIERRFVTDGEGRLEIEWPRPHRDAPLTITLTEELGGCSAAATIEAPPADPDGRTTYPFPFPGEGEGGAPEVELRDTDGLLRALRYARDRGGLRLAAENPELIPDRVRERLRRLCALLDVRWLDDDAAPAPDDAPAVVDKDGTAPAHPWPGALPAPGPVRLIIDLSDAPARRSARGNRPDREAEFEAWPQVIKTTPAGTGRGWIFPLPAIDDAGGFAIAVVGSDPVGVLRAFDVFDGWLDRQALARQLRALPRLAAGTGTGGTGRGAVDAGARFPGWSAALLADGRVASWRRADRDPPAAWRGLLTPPNHAPSAGSSEPASGDGGASPDADSPSPAAPSPSTAPVFDAPPAGGALDEAEAPASLGGTWAGVDGENAAARPSPSYGSFPEAAPFPASRPHHRCVPVADAAWNPQSATLTVTTLNPTTHFAVTLAPDAGASPGSPPRPERRPLAPSENEGDITATGLRLSLRSDGGAVVLTASNANAGGGKGGAARPRWRFVPDDLPADVDAWIPALARSPGDAHFLLRCAPANRDGRDGRRRETFYYVLNADGAAVGRWREPADGGAALLSISLDDRGWSAGLYAGGALVVRDPAGTPALRRRRSVPARSAWPMPTPAGDGSGAWVVELSGRLVFLRPDGVETVAATLAPGLLLPAPDAAGRPRWFLVRDDARLGALSVDGRPLWTVPLD